MTRLRLRLVVPAALLTSASLALAYSSGPPTSETGAISIGLFPRENTCILCHAGNPANAAVGSLQIVGVPNPYEPGTPYTLTVQLASDRTAANATRKWGFEITAIRADDGSGTGTFSVLDPTTTKAVAGSGAFAGRTYVEHTSAGTQTGAASPVSWQVQWTAPNLPAPFRVYFFAAGNAANGNGASTGDFIYTTVESTTVDVTPTLPTTWGQVKSKYRP